MIRRIGSVKVNASMGIKKELLSTSTSSGAKIFDEQINLKGLEKTINEIKNKPYLISIKMNKNTIKKFEKYLVEKNDNLHFYGIKIEESLLPPDDFLFLVYSDLRMEIIKLEWEKDSGNSKN